MYDLNNIDYVALKNGGFMRQVQDNYFSLRLKVVGGNISAEQLLIISEAAKKYAAGRVHLTSRQGIEIPFVALENINNIKKFLEDGGVYTSACGAQVRTVTACQGADMCGSGCIETSGLALEISKRYFGKILPHKFKIGITGCANNCLKAEENDLGIKGGKIIKYNKNTCKSCGACVKACRVGAINIKDGKININKRKCVNCGRCAKACKFGSITGESCWIVSFGGTFGNKILPGKRIIPAITDKEILFKVMDAAVNFFANNAQSKERFRFAIERVGWDKFRQDITL